MKTELKYTTPWTTRSLSKRIRATVGVGVTNHAYISATAETQRMKRGLWEYDSCGCLHEQIKEAFPELEPFVRLHLSDADTGMPMYAVENGVHWVRVALGLDHYKSQEVGAQFVGELWRITPEQVASFLDDITASEKDIKTYCMEYVLSQRERWQQEVDDLHKLLADLTAPTATTN